MDFSELRYFILQNESMKLIRANNPLESKYFGCIDQSLIILLEFKYLKNDLKKGVN